MIFWLSGNRVGEVINEAQLRSTSNFIYKLAVAIGIVVMFIVGTILSIKFIVSSAEDKAKVKEALIPFYVGCAIVIGSFTIWDIVVNLGQDATSSSYGQSYSSRTFTFYAITVRGATDEQESIYCSTKQELRDAINRYSSVSYAAQGLTVEIEYEHPVTYNRIRQPLSEFISIGMYDTCLDYL